MDLELETEPYPLPTSIVLLSATVWFLAAVLIARSGALNRLHVPLPFLAPPLTVALVFAYGRLPMLRAWFRAHLRGVLFFHTVRFVGIYFLILHEAGRMPFEFAVPAGVGDVAVAVGALAMVVTFNFRRPVAKQRALLLWNTLGLLDILSVLATAAYLAITDPASIAPLWQLPLSLLPMFVVPLVVASHLAIFRMARSERHTVFLI